MPDTTLECLDQAVRTAASLYHRLVLLVGPQGSGKTVLLQALAAKLGLELHNVNLELSKALLELTARQRALAVPRLLDDLACGATETLLLDNCEILFDAELRQDPLRLLQGLSRNRTVVASWNGQLSRGKLTYATPEHPEHRTYEAADLVLVQIGGNEPLTSHSTQENGDTP